MTQRALTAAEMDELVERVVRGVVDRLDARIRKARPSAKRRTKDPELAAQLAREQVSGPVDEVARARGRAAVAKLRRAGR